MRRVMFRDPQGSVGTDQGDGVVHWSYGKDREGKDITHVSRAVDPKELLTISEEHFEKFIAMPAWSMESRQLAQRLFADAMAVEERAHEFPLPCDKCGEANVLRDASGRMRRTHPCIVVKVTASTPTAGATDAQLADEWLNLARAAAKSALREAESPDGGKTEFVADQSRVSRHDFEEVDQRRAQAVDEGDAARVEVRRLQQAFDTLQRDFERVSKQLTEEREVRTSAIIGGSLIGRRASTPAGDSGVVVAVALTGGHTFLALILLDGGHLTSQQAITLIVD